VTLFNSEIALDRLVMKNKTKLQKTMSKVSSFNSDKSSKEATNVLTSFFSESFFEILKLKFEPFGHI
jgi:hypothetical protein